MQVHEKRYMKCAGVAGLRVRAAGLRHLQVPTTSGLKLKIGIIRIKIYVIYSDVPEESLI